MKNFKVDDSERLFMECEQVETKYDDIIKLSSHLLPQFNSKILKYYLYIILFCLNTVLVQCSPITILSYNTANLNFANTVKLPPLYWNSKNILFSSSMPNYLTINARIGDNIDLVCPKYDADNNLSVEYSTIYKVGTKYEFDNCLVDLNNPETVPLLKCDKPFSGPIKYTIYFVKYSPVPFALEFQENKEYYFISASTGHKNGINSKLGGLCSSNNMKFSIKINPTAQETMNNNNNNIHNNNDIYQQETNEETILDKFENTSDKFLSLIFTGAFKSHSNSNDTLLTNANYLISNATISSKFYTTLILICLIVIIIF
jgi:hypothetical protein